MTERGSDPSGALWEALETRLDRLEAERDVAKLFANYAAACDAPDLDLAAGCFAPDGHLSITPFAGGRAIDLRGSADIRKFFSALPPRADRVRQHGVLEQRISLAEDAHSGTSESIFFVLGEASTHGGSGMPVVGMFGRYSDRIVRIAGRWYFSCRHITVDADQRGI